MAATGTVRTADGKAGTRDGTVLVFDDEERVRSFMQAALEIFGYRVLLAENGRQAEMILSTNAGVDLVVLDLVTPGPRRSGSLSGVAEEVARSAVPDG